MRTRKPTNIGAMLEWHAGRSAQTVFHLDRPFDIAPHAGTTVDGAAAASIVNEAAAWWYAAGARPGDRVAIVKDNHFDILLFAAAAARMGAIPAIISSSTRPTVLRELISRIVPVVTAVSPNVLVAALSSNVDLACSGRLVLLGGVAPDGFQGDLVRLDDLRGAADAPVRMRSDSDAMIICHTSGTTGLPKLVVHSAQTLYEANRLDSMRMPVLASRRKDVFGTAISFAHVRATGTLTAQLSHAPSKVVIIADYDLTNVSRVLADHRLTILEACPNIFLRWQSLTKSEPGLFERIRLYFNTFDLIHPSTVRSFLAASRRPMPLWLQGWGQSETGPLTGAIYTRSRLRQVTGSSAVTSDIGWSVPGFSRVRVVDSKTRRHQPIGKSGLLMSSSRGRCLDYLGEHHRHLDKVEGNWWNTGDVGYRDWLGRIRLVDREVDMIPGISGIDVESALLDRMEEASEVTVLGVPGQLPVPILCLPSGSIDEDRWAAVTAGLPPLGRPLVMPWDEIPRTSTWKVRRLELREMALGTDQTFGTGRWI